MGDSKTTEAWDANDIAGARPAGQWQYYREGVIVPIPEEEARKQFERWKILSDGRGMATFMLDQLWDEIDKLRALVDSYSAVPFRCHDCKRKLTVEELVINAP